MIEINQGATLKAICKQRDYPVPRLADDLGLTREYVYAMFNKKFIGSEIIEKSCLILDVSPSAFFTARTSDQSVTILIISGDVRTSEEIIQVDRSRVISVQSFRSGVENKHEKR